MIGIRSATAYLGLILVFALLAALSTVVIWILLSLCTAEPFAIDKLPYWAMAAGATGPILVLWAVRRATGAAATPMQRRLRASSTIASITVLVVELLYLILLGILNLAYSGVRM